MLTRDTTAGRHRSRRGLTLVEMLVTLAVLLIMMTAIVQIFQAATGTLSASRAYQELDTGLRRLDSTIRSDFAGVTAKLTPPNNPKDNRGYFEYGENAFADLQGEDSDDYVRFTTMAPPDRPFIGRFWPNGSTTPISITSQHAEVIYFLRNGNLYRRVFLITPERQNAVFQTSTFANVALLGGSTVSWQGMNDVSARPGASFGSTGSPISNIILNSLGDLTNRENRAFSPRFANDFVTVTPVAVGDPSIIAAGVDQNPDDLNFYGNPASRRYPGNGVPDYYPTLYPLVFSAGLIYEEGGTPTRTTGGVNVSTMAFPYIFPGAYSHPDPASRAVGWLHSPTPVTSNTANAANYLLYLRRLNHNPLDLGDNLPRPATTGTAQNSFGGLQTWWGFPTWRETLSSNWSDPARTINVPPYSQPPGLTPRFALIPATGAVADDPNLLPPMSYNTSQSIAADVFNVMRPAEQPYSDALGGTSAFLNAPWVASWEDDLIMTGVRSFDIKILDGALGDYVDLGWGDDTRLPAVLSPAAGSFLNANPSNLVIGVNGGDFDILNATFAHEGRMPPLIEDLRFDAQFGAATYPGFAGYNGNIGDSRANVIRLRRVWDSWSTDYSAAPARGFNPQTKAPIGPPVSPPVYPSYPPPYPAPLRGLQIQIRVQDPTGKYVKSLTIRQDFTEKLK